MKDLLSVNIEPDDPYGKNEHHPVQLPVMKFGNFLFYVYLRQGLVTEIIICYNKLVIIFLQNC